MSSPSYPPGEGQGSGEHASHIHGDPSLVSTDERNMAALCHLLGLVWTVTLIGGVVGPLILWILKKDESEFIDFHGKQAINFQIVMLIGYVISVPLVCVWIGILTFLVFAVVNLVFPIIGAVKASQGERYVYPFTYDFLK